MRAAACFTALAALLAAAPAPSRAANADEPNARVDRSNDSGIATGNDRVDDLNKKQLDENQPRPQPAPPPPK